MPEAMSEKTRELFMIFRDAVQREREAQAIYKRAADLCEDEEIKKLLESFYKDEVRHEEALIQRYNDLRNIYGVAEA